ncbi:hypothetical protein KC345_g2313 [Hortaea werneckii]|nr:hypothetical protein KC345_g2313 [Hortaea werneckii]
MPPPKSKPGRPPPLNQQLQIAPSGPPKAYAQKNASSLKAIEYTTAQAKYRFALSHAGSKSDNVDLLRTMHDASDLQSLKAELYEFESIFSKMRETPEVLVSCLAMEEMSALVSREMETSRERCRDVIEDIGGQISRVRTENVNLRTTRARYNWLRIGSKILRQIRARRNWKTTIDSLIRHSVAMRLRVRRQMQTSQATQEVAQRADLSRALSIERWQRAIRTVQLHLQARQVSHNAAQVAILKPQSTSLKRQVYALRSFVRHEDCRFDVLRDQLAHRRQQLRNQRKSRAAVTRERDDLQQQVHSTEKRLAQIEHVSLAVAQHVFPELRRQECLIRDGQRVLSSMLNHFDEARARSARERRLFSRRLHDLHEALRQQTTDFNRASESVRQLTAKLKDHKHRNRELASSATTLRSDLERKTADYNAASGDVQRLECEITELKDNLADLRLSYEYLTYRNEELDQSLSASAEEVALLEGEVTVLTERLETLDRSSEELTYENARLMSAVETLTSEKQEVVNQNAHLDQCIKAVTGHITYAKDQAQGLTEEVEDLKRSNEELTYDNASLESAVETLTSEKQEVIHQNAHLDRRQDSAQRQIGKLTEEVAHLKRFNGELARFNEELTDDKESSLATLNSEKQEIIDQNVELDRYNKELADRITGAEHRVVELSENIELLEQSNETLTHSSNEMYMSNTTLESDKQEALHQNAELNKSVRTITERCAHAEFEIRNITRARDDFANETVKLEQQLNDSEDLVKRFRDHTYTLEGRVSELEDRNDKDRADQRRGLMEKQQYVENTVSWYEGRIRDCEQEFIVRDNRSLEMTRHYLQQAAEQKSWYLDELQRVKRMKTAAAAYSRSPKMALKHLAMQFSSELRETESTTQQIMEVATKIMSTVQMLGHELDLTAEVLERLIPQHEIAISLINTTFPYSSFDVNLFFTAHLRASIGIPSTAFTHARYLAIYDKEDPTTAGVMEIYSDYDEYKNICRDAFHRVLDVIATLAAIECKYHEKLKRMQEVMLYVTKDCLSLVGSGLTLIETVQTLLERIVHECLVPSSEFLKNTDEAVAKAKCCFIIHALLQIYVAKHPDGKPYIGEKPVWMGAPVMEAASKDLVVRYHWGEVYGRMLSLARFFIMLANEIPLGQSSRQDAYDKAVQYIKDNNVKWADGYELPQRYPLP